MSANDRWLTISAVPDDELVEARIQLHYSAQLVAALGATLLPPAADDSHPNFGWSPEHQALIGRPLVQIPVQAALKLADPSLLVLREDRIVATIKLAGSTLLDARGALEQALREEGVALPEGGLELPPYDLPSHALSQGAAFVPVSVPACEALSRWYANAARTIGSCITRVEPNASDLRCWPHHFDLATLIAEEVGADGIAKRTIGVGLSPGDGSYAEPYWYVSPWPYPDAGALPALPAGARWHTEGFTAAVLTGSDLIATGPSAEQSQRASAFLYAAVAASRQLLA
ncbi:MAG: hypothetical protein E4H03_10490 [Myxococcales bacterium]|nr:MAG: hypothetical protein E4H03_10490 [Myxococcales bacterium]